MSTISELNDRLRRTGEGGHIMATHKVRQLDESDLRRVFARVQTFCEFDAGNDPHREHDFGAFDIDIDGETEKFFWKIDYYDKQLNYHSENPADPTVTTRVLTIMLASEY